MTGRAETVEDQTLRRLLGHDRGPCVTIHYTPTNGVDEDPEAARLRLAALLDRARDDLVDRELPLPRVRELLAPAQELAAPLADVRRRRETVALFLAPGCAEGYVLHDGPSDRVEVGDRFVLRHLVLAPLRRPPYVVAVLDHKQARLIEVARDGSVSSVPLPREEHTLPPKVRDVREQSLQYHAVGGTGTGRAPVMYHGHGGAKELSDEPLHRFIHSVARRVDDRLRGSSTPVVIAAGPDLANELAGAMTHGAVLADCLVGNPKAATDQRLADAAWELVEADLFEQRRHELERLNDLRGTARWEDDPEAVVQAAREGRVDALVVTTSAVERPEGQEPLVEEAVTQTWTHGGSVLEVPDKDTDGLDLGATLRW